MTKELIIITIILVLAYYYWPQPVTTQATDSPDQSEFKQPVAQAVANLGNSLPEPVPPILSRKQRRQLKKKK